MRRFQYMILTLTLALGLSGSGLAGPIVVFSDGRSLEVSRVERADGTATLFFTDGGAMQLPDSRIENWEAISSYLPPPAAPAPPAAKPALAWRHNAGAYAELIGSAAERYSVDPVLLTAMVHVESAFDPSAVSPKGAQGLLQLMPGTAVRFGVEDPFDARQSVEGGAAYLSWLLDRFDGQTELALAGYNAGEGNVDRYQGVPPYRETVQYVQRVMDSAAGMRR